MRIDPRSVSGWRVFAAEHPAGGSRAGDEQMGLESARDRLAAALAEHARLGRAFAETGDLTLLDAMRGARALVEALERWLGLLERPRRG